MQVVPQIYPVPREIESWMTSSQCISQTKPNLIRPLRGAAHQLKQCSATLGKGRCMCLQNTACVDETFLSGMFKLALNSTIRPTWEKQSSETATWMGVRP